MADENKDSVSADGKRVIDAGNDASLPADYQRLRSQLVRSVNRVCPPWLANQREDIVQAALLRVVVAQKKGETAAAPPSSYMWKVAYSATVDEIRRARRRQEVPLEPILEQHSEPVMEETPFEAQALEALGRGIRDCMARLNEARRLVVGLHLIGHTLSELTTLLSWKSNRVRNLLYRGLDDLRRCLVRKGLKP